MTESTLKYTAIASWFGSNRMLSKYVAEELHGLGWVGVPFAGGMTEILSIKARSLVVSDLHRHVINLARTIASPEHKDKLIERLVNVAFHPDELDGAQKYCKAVESHEGYATWDEYPCLEWAANYFICCWMGRNGKAGTDSEFSGAPSMRWNAGGGDSAVRYRNAVSSIDAMHKLILRCTFHVLDAFEAIKRTSDESTNGIYCDPPFPGPGDAYKHKFTEAQQRQLVEQLSEFQHTRVVCRFYDVPMIRELYPEPRWRWRHLEGRKASNAPGPEVLLVLNGAK